MFVTPDTVKYKVCWHNMILYTANDIHSARLYMREKSRCPGWESRHLTLVRIDETVIGQVRPR